MNKRVVWKFLLDVKDDIQAIEMPGTSKIISTDMMGNTIAIWAIVDPDSKPVIRYFRIYGTGHVIVGDNYLQFIGTCLQRSQYLTATLVWHVFEVLGLG